MFFWKKKEKKEPSANVASTLPEQDHGVLRSEIDTLLTALETAEGEEKVSCLNRIGALYKTCGEPLDAIQYYEKSMEESKTFGEACTALMALYNQMRKEAAKSGDAEKIQYYLRKLDALMATNKSIMRSSLS